MAANVTTWQKGNPSPNPSGKPRAERLAARSLAIACREAATDEEVAEWLLSIASGQWPDIRPKAKRGEGPLVQAMESPPGENVRMQALKEFLLRRDGQPMQSVALIADIEARARRIENASDAIEIEAFDPAIAGALEIALVRALGAGTNTEPDELENTPGVIDVPSAEVP